MTSNTRSDDVRAQLLQLSRELGVEARRLAILGEGNTSARIGDETFWVKASGSQLSNLDESGVVECRFAPLLDLIANDNVDDERVERELLACRVDENGKKPSVEAMFHADLLGLPDVHFVGHAHPIAVNAILCSSRAAQFAQGRSFPDEIVCCGEASVLVPYCDPGLALAQNIRRRVADFRAEYEAVPRVILLQNHGVITLGATPQAVLAAMLMCVKAAEIFAGACALGEPQGLSRYEVARISGRKDEHHRQKVLGLK